MAAYERHAVMHLGDNAHVIDCYASHTLAAVNMTGGLMRFKLAAGLHGVGQVTNMSRVRFDFEIWTLKRCRS